MANLFDRLQETFTLPSNDNSNDASVDIEKEDSAKPNVTQENNGDAASRRGLVSAYTVNKQDGGKTKVVGTTSSANADDAAKMKTESSFVIPKRKKDDTDILVDLMINSREFQYEILPAIVKSYRNAQSSEKFKYTKVQSVHNRDLLKLYLEKRKELRSSGYSDKEASDCVAFLCVEDEELMYKICRDGVPIGNYPQSCLGHPMMGVQLCKHADVIKSTPLHPNETGYLILFKIIKGRIKSVAESISENPLEPTPHYDCHVISTPPDASASPSSLFESSQVYMYEYGEEGVLQYPRNVCPVAVVSFVYEKDSRDPKSNSPSNLTKKDELYNELVADFREKELSFPKATAKSDGQYFIQYDSRLDQQVHHPVYRGGSAPLRGEGDKEFVVWSGSLTIKGLYACNVEMTSAAAFVKPAALGGQINISSKLGVKQVQQKYLKNVSGIRRSSEGYWNGYYINACELRPMSAEGRSHFQRVMNYLGKHNAVAVQKLKKDVTLLMLTQSELTYQLGLSRPHQYPVLLYCLFLSKSSARKRLVHTAAVHKESSHPAHNSSKLPHPPGTPPLPPTNPIKSEEHAKTPQSSPFLPPSSPYSVPPSPKRDYYRSPSSNIVSWPQNPQFGSPRNFPVPHSTPPQSPIAYGTAPVPSTPPYGVPHSPQMSQGGPLHTLFHNHYQSPEFSGNSPQRRSSRDGLQCAPYPPESKSSFIPPSTFQSGPKFEPHYIPRPNFSPRSPYHFPPRTGDPRFQGPVQQFGNDLGYGGPRFPDPSWNFMQGPTFPDRFDPSRSPSLPSFPTCIPSDPKFNTPPYLKMHNVSNETFHSPYKPDWSHGSPHPPFSPDKANIKNVQTTLHRSDPRLIKNASPKVNPVAPMPRGSTSESLGSPINAGISPVDFSSAKMSPISLPSPQQMPGPSGTPPLPQGPPVPPLPVVPLPEPPKPSRVSPGIPVSYDSGFLYKPPASSLLQPEKIRKVFEEQCVAQEIQQRAKEAIKRHLLARSRIESKKKQGLKVCKMEEKKSELAIKEKMVESAEDMKQLLESSLDPKFAVKKKVEQVKKKEKPRPEGVKEKHKAKEKHMLDKLKCKAKHAEGRPKDKEGSVESVKLKIPEPETFKLDSLEDIARMRKITEAEIKKESERLDMDDMDLDEDPLEEVSKKSKKRPKERENVDEKRRPSETDELSSKKAKIDTANDMKNFLNLSLEENKPQESVSSKSEVVGSDDKSIEVVVPEEAKSVKPIKPAPEIEQTKEKSKVSDSTDNRNQNVEESASAMIESKKDKAKNKSDVEKMETDSSDQPGRWDNPTKKKRQESESEGERKIENQKGKIIIIKEIRMIRVNSDGSEIKSPDKEAEKPALEKGISRAVSPVPIPLEENSKVTEKKDRNADTKRSERDGGKRKESKREVDKRRTEKDERREKSNRKDERRAKERSGGSHDRRKSEDSRKNLVHYSDSESTTSRSRSSSCRSETPKSDDGRGSVPRYTKVYPDFKPSRPIGKYPKAASTSHNRSVSERKPGDQRRGSLHQRSRYQHDSKSYSYKKGKPGVSKRTDLQGFGKVKSVFHSKKDFKAQQAIIEGIITSAKMPLKKIPKIQKQKQPLSISTSTLDHATPSPLHSSEDMKDLSEDVQSNSSTTVLEQTESQQQMETTSNSEATCEYPIESIGGESTDSLEPLVGKLEEKKVLLEVTEPKRLETVPHTGNKNHLKAQSADMKELSENEPHLKAPAVHIKDPSALEESVTVIQAEDHVKANSSDSVLPWDVAESAECPQEEVHEVCNIEKSDQKIGDIPVSSTDIKTNTTESRGCESQDKVFAQSLSKEDGVTSDIRNKIENTSTLKKATKKRSMKMEKDLLNVMNQFLPQPERNVKDNLDINKQSMEQEPAIKNHEDIIGDSKEGRFMMSDLVDLESGRDFHQANEVSSTFSLTSQLSNDKNLLNSVEPSSIGSHFDKPSDHQTCENKNLISKAQEDKLDTHEGSKREMDASHPEHGKKHRSVFSEASHPGLDAGIVHGQWSDDHQMCSEDEFDPDTDRVVQDGPNPLELKITVTNDTPVESKFKWISREQLVKDCIHGIHDNSPYSLKEAILVNSINSVVHKTLPEKEGRVRSISTSESTHNGDTEATYDGNHSDDELVYRFEEEAFQLEKSPRLCEDEEATVVSNTEKEEQETSKDSEKIGAAVPEVEKIINLVRSQFEDGNDDTTVSSLSSSQTSFRSLSSSQNSQDKFEKVLSDQLNSISQGLDMLMNFDSNSLSFITPDEGKQLNHVIENTMKTLKASMQSQNVDPGKNNSEITNTFTAPEIRDQEKTEETAELENAENAAESNENLNKESVQEKKTEGPHDETAFWSKILGFSMQECKTLPSFFSTPPKTEKKADEDSSKENIDVTVMSEISESNKKNTTDTCQVSGMDSVIVISDSPKSNDFVQSPLSGGSEKNNSKVFQSNKMDTDLIQEVDDVIVISDSPISTNVIIKSPSAVNSEKNPEVDIKNEISSNVEEESKLDGSTVTTGSSQEEGKDQKIHISPIRFPDSTCGKEIRMEKTTETEEVLDDNNNTEVSNTTGEKDKNTIPKIRIDFVDEKRKKLEQEMVKSGRKEDSSKNLLLNASVSGLRDRVKSKTPPLEVPVPVKKISPQEKTLTVIIPETKRKLIAQRQSPTLAAQTEAKKLESSPRRSPNIQSEIDQLASGSETVPAQLSTSQQSRRRSVFSRLSPLINEEEKEGKKERSESPINEVRTIQLGPSLSSKNEQSIKETGDGENKKTKSKKDDLVLITINNEKTESKSKKSRSRSRSSGGKKLSEYKPPPTSANAEPLTTQAGPIRNTGKSKREERQYHPYRKEPSKKKNTWSFDIAYDSLRELMHDLTVSSYKSQHHRPKHCRTNSRFANYTFVRSNVPETLPGGNPDEEEVDEEFNENAIPDFEERKRKADLVDELTLGEQEEDDYTTERQVYSMEDSEHPEQENVTKTEEPDQKILPRMLFNLPSRNATISSPSESNKDIKTEEKKFKTEPVNTEIKSSEAARTVVKSERVIEIYRKTGPIKRENSPSYGGTLDLDARENGKKENTEQVSNNDLPIDFEVAEVKTQAMETVNYPSEKTTVHFVNPSSKGVGDDEDLEVDECSDWIVLDDASDDIGNTDASTLPFDEEASPSNVNQKSNNESHSSVDHGSTGIPDVDMKEEIHDIFSVQGTSAVNLRPNAADVCKSIINGERAILEFSENTFSSITTDSEAKMEEANDICMEEAESTSRSGNIVESHNEIKDSNSSLDKTVLEVQDMSVSEEEGAAKQSEDETGDCFVPVIYLKGVSGGNFWHKNNGHKFEENDCLVKELDQDQESGPIDNKINSKMDISSSVVKSKSPDDLENVDKEKPNVSKSAEISVLEKEFASYIGRGSSKVEHNSPVEDPKTSDNLKVELDKDKPTGSKSGEIFLAEKEFACYIGRGPSHVETKIFTASPETSSIMGTTSFEQPLANISSPSLHIQEAVQDMHDLKEAESQCDYQKPVESDCNSKKETEGSKKVALKLENEVKSNENEQTDVNSSSQKVRQNEQRDEGKDLIEAAVNCEMNDGESKQGTESEKENNEETPSDKFPKPKDNVNSFAEATNNFKGTIVGADNSKEISNAPEEVHEIEASNRHPVDLEKENVENDMNLSGCCSVNATSTPNKKSFNSVQSVHVNNSDSLDDKIDDSVWICSTEKVEELSNTEKGEGLGLLMKNYDQYSGSESFNSSAELSSNQNVLGVNADNVEDSLKETCQERDFTCDSEMSSVTKNAEKISQNADMELKEGKAEEGDEIENPREADSSFDTEQRLEDIMSVIGESQPEISPIGGVRHSSQIKVLTVSSSECDLCDDQLCLAKVKCLTGPLDPLEEAMLSSGILNINDVPIGNEIEIDSDDPVNILHLSNDDRVPNEEKELSECQAAIASSSDMQTKSSNVYTAAPCYTTDKLTEANDCGSLHSDSEVEDEGDTSSTETDYISDSVDSETEAATRGDDWSKLIVSEYLHTKQSNKGIDTVCNLPLTKSVQFLQSNHSQKNQESTRQKEVAADCSKPWKPLSQSINRQVKSRQEPASQFVYKKNQSIVRPLVPNSTGLSTPLAIKSTASNSMCSAPLLRQFPVMMQNFNLSGARFSMMSPHQISLNPLMLFYAQSQFPSYSNAARTLTPLPLFFPYATNYPTGPQVNPLLSMQMFSPLSPSPAFELTTDKFEAFRRMNNGSEPHFQSSLLGTVPFYGGINPPQSPLHCPSLPSSSPCRTGSFYLNRQVTQERSSKITECLRNSSTYSTTDGSPLLPPISSFTQRKVSNMNSAESAFSPCKTPPAPQNTANQQSSYTIYNKEISTQIYSGKSFRKPLPEPTGLSPLDMTVSAQSNTGSSQKQASACSRNLFENLNQNTESLQHSTRDKRMPGKIPVGHVRPMSFSSFRDFQKD